MMEKMSTKLIHQMIIYSTQQQLRYVFIQKLLEITRLKFLSPTLNVEHAIRMLYVDIQHSIAHTIVYTFNEINFERKQINCFSSTSFKT